jgi:hypothetical protein
MTISPLFFVALIAIGLAVIESLLLARFWLQAGAASASDGAGALIMDASRPLVAPFSDQTARAQDVGRLDGGTLIAALVYFAVGAALAVLTGTVAAVLTGARYVIKPRRVVDWRNPLPKPAGTDLVNVASLTLTPEQARRALRRLRLERSGPEFHVIPSADGCVVAAFAGRQAGSRVPGLGRLVAGRQAAAVKRAFRAMEHGFPAVEPLPEDPP